jgi:peroxiredoxin
MAASNLAKSLALLALLPALLLGAAATAAQEEGKKEDPPKDAPKDEPKKEGESKEGEKKTDAEKEKEKPETAPAFKLKDLAGKERTLEEFKGKYVVLEWINHDCPFVKKHYSSGNMQDLQKKYVEKGVVWLSVCSSAEGKEGHMTVKEWEEKQAEVKAAPTAVLLDADGTVGKAYKAARTPHMVVVGKEGEVLYKGAIDDKPTAKPADAKGAKNYVAEALDAAMAGKPIEVKATTAYG